VYSSSSLLSVNLAQLRLVPVADAGSSIFDLSVLLSGHRTFDLNVSFRWRTFARDILRVLIVIITSVVGLADRLNLRHVVRNTACDTFSCVPVLFVFCRELTEQEQLITSLQDFSDLVSSTSQAVNNWSVSFWLACIETFSLQFEAFKVRHGAILLFVIACFFNLLNCRHSPDVTAALCQ